MKVGLVGAGRMGSGLAAHWHRAGHELFFGLRDPAKAAEAARGLGPDVGSGGIAEAADFGEAVLLAVPWSAIPSVLEAAGPLEGKTVIDCTNPIAWSGGGMAMAVGHTDSGAETVARLAGGAHVVKAFNTTYAPLVRGGGRFGDQRAMLLLCGDDDGAKGRVATLAEDAGFAPVDLGPLGMARFLEPFAGVMIALQRLPGMGSDMGLTTLHRTGSP